MASFIFIANQACRTGGNLLNRLFDGNKNSGFCSNGLSESVRYMS